MTKRDPLWTVLGLLFRAHPWHGVSIGDREPDVVTAYVEIVPSDTVKYELDKASGHLKIDRPQAYSNICPAIYGLLPQTFCGEQVAQRCEERSGRKGIVGDGDPLDICILAEKFIPHGDILMQAIPIGGIRMLDGNEADDKIIAVMSGDAACGTWRDITDCPQKITDRLRHYFLTYKSAPDSPHTPCEISEVYGREEAHEVIRRSRADYMKHFAHLEEMLTAALRD